MSIDDVERRRFLHTPEGSSPRAENQVDRPTMDAHTFVSDLLPLRDEAVTQFIAKHAPEVDDLDTVAQQIKDEAQAQETRDLNISLIIPISCWRFLIGQAT